MDQAGSGPHRRPQGQGASQVGLVADFVHLIVLQVLVADFGCALGSRFCCATGLVADFGCAKECDSNFVVWA